LNGVFKILKPGLPKRERMGEAPWRCSKKPAPVPERSILNYPSRESRPLFAAGLPVPLTTPKAAFGVGPSVWTQWITIVDRNALIPGKAKHPDRRKAILNREWPFDSRIYRSRRSLAPSALTGFDP
jgi:hypothetical protein